MERDVRVVKEQEMRRLTHENARLQERLAALSAKETDPRYLTLVFFYTLL